MKRYEFYKKIIDNNIACKDSILHATLNGTSDEKTYKCEFNFKKSAVRFTACFLVTAVVVFGGITKFTSFKECLQGKQSRQKIGHTFTVTAYAGESQTSEQTKKVLNKNVKVPAGKVYANGKLTLKCGLYICKDNNIENVTYTSLKQNLEYIDMKKLKKFDESYTCKINFTSSQMDMNWDNMKRIEVFKKMWNDGELDEYKNKYFNGKSVDINDYMISFGPENGGTYAKVINKKGENSDYFKSGLSISTKAGEPIYWHPVNAISVISNPIKFRELSQDTVTITVKFKDGQTAVKIIKLSFDNEGNLIAELKDK